jgi:hypothetical protein
MASAIGTIECPKCTFEGAVCDDYYKTNEIYMWCDECGWSYTRERKRDADFKFLGDGKKREHYIIEEVPGSGKIWKGARNSWDEAIEKGEVPDSRKMRKDVRSSWDDAIEKGEGL